MFFKYDALDRLTAADRGDWNGTAIVTQLEDRDWTLDQEGNFDLMQ